MVRSIDEAIGRIEAAEVLEYFGHALGRSVRQAGQGRGDHLAVPRAGRPRQAGPERRPMVRAAGFLGLAPGPLDRG